MVARRSFVVFAEVWSAHAFSWDKTWHQCARDYPNFEESQVFKCLRSRGTLKRQKKTPRSKRREAITQQGGVISQKNALDNYTIPKSSVSPISSTVNHVLVGISTSVL